MPDSAERVKSAADKEPPPPVRLLGLAPLIGQHPSLLILGSFPSEISIAQQQYYGNPRNHFWDIAGNVLGIPRPESYKDRCRMVTDNGIAIWDVFASCERMGSLDQSIRNAQTNDIAALVEANPGISRILLNGAAAAKGFAALTGIHLKSSGAYPRIALWRHGNLSLQLFCLPSTSPIPTRQFRGADDKLPSWRQALSIVSTDSKSGNRG